MSNSRPHIALSEESEAFVQREWRARGFESASAFVESLLRDAQRQSAHDRAEQLVLEGVASGEPIIADDAFWSRLRSELNSRIRYPKTA